MTAMRVVVVFVSLCFAGCFVAPQEECSASNCPGCCDSGGACRAGDSISACGAAGEACALCVGGDVCSVGVCTTASTGGGSATGGGTGTGGGSATGGGGGGGVPADCTVPSSLDFGVVGLGTSTTRSFVLTNSTPRPASAQVNFDAAGHQFRVTPEGGVGIAAGNSVQVMVTLDASALGAAQARLLVRPAAECPLATVQLTGEVRDGVLSWTPATVNFGFVRPGSTGTVNVAFTNNGNVPVRFSNGSATPAPTFSLAPAAFTLAPGGSQTVMLRFSPAALGPRSGTVLFQTDVATQSNISIPVSGVGGGPELRVHSPLAFGDTGLGDTRTLQLPVANVGARPSPPDPAGNLRFGTPAFELVAGAGTSVSDFYVTLPPNYDPAVGILGGDAISLLVAFTPTSLGPKQATLRLFTNDPVTPVFSVELTGNALTLPPCSVSVSSASGIDFGRVRFGRSLAWPVTISNTNTTSCEVYGATIMAGAGHFSLEGTSGGTLAPGASLRFLVRFTAPRVATTSVTSHPGLLRISRAGQPDVDLTLSASTGPSCLLTPERVDYGSATVGCRSAALGVHLLNTCSTSVTLNSGSVASPAFTDSNNSPVAWTGGIPVASRSFHPAAVRFTPVNVGDDLSHLVVNASEGTSVVRYVVPLMGRGVSAGAVVEDFAPETDRTALLFVVDNSGSMADEQMALANVSSALFSPTSPLDLRVGVIVADPADPQRGRLRRTSSGAAWVANVTPNATTELAALLNIGIFGGSIESCLEPTTVALTDTARYLATENANFALDGDRLAVVCVTDASEQSPNSPDYDFTRLRLSQDTRSLDRFSYSVIGPFSPSAPSGCSYDGSNDGRHAQAVSAFNGATGEICTNDWNVTLGQVLQPALRPRAYTLRRAVDLTAQAVQVRVGGQLIPELGAGGQRHWTFDPSTRRLQFEPLAAPASGSTVSVTYAPMCF